MRRAALVGAAAVLVVLLVAELVAVPIATRMVGDALARCLPHERVEITAVDRPAVPRLLTGRATGVEMQATGLVLGGLRVDRAHLQVPEVILPWAWGEPRPQGATLELALLDQDLERFLGEGLPLGLTPSVDLSPGVAELGVDPFPVRVEVAVSVVDRMVEISPAGEVPDWWDRLPIPERFLLPEDLHLDALHVHEGSVATTLVVDELPGLDGATECHGPLA